MALAIALAFFVEKCVLRAMAATRSPPSLGSSQWLRREIVSFDTHIHGFRFPQRLTNWSSHAIIFHHFQICLPDRSSILFGSLKRVGYNSHGNGGKSLSFAREAVVQRRPPLFCVIMADNYPISLSASHSGSS